jgi:hypothetical protein
MIGARALYGGLVVVLAAALAAACVPVTVNVTFPSRSSTTPRARSST